MYVRSTIQQIIAGVLLIIFAFSITPKQALHDWLANHKDNTGTRYHGDLTHISTSGFNCDCDNLVAESPFTHQAQLFAFRAVRVFIPRPAFIAHHFYSATPFYFSLRGPPAGISI